MRDFALLVVLSATIGCSGPEPGLTVFAAASTTDVLTEITQAYEAGSGREVRLNFGGSGVLARQIVAGAPADVFLSASRDWVDYLLEDGSADADSRCVPMRNRLVLVAPGNVREEVPATTNLTSILANAEGLVAMGDPGHVPAGQYAREALQTLRVYDGLAGDGRLLFTPNVRAALALVELGECDLGIVYATDALRSRTVRTLGSFPAETHGPIDYAMVCAADASRQAREFAAFLCSAEAAVLLEHHGFEPVSSAGP